MNLKKCITGILLSTAASFSFGDVKPATIVGDGMVFQSGMPMRVWGTADAGEAVKVTFMGKSAKTKADNDGRWHVELPKSSYVREGQTLTIEGKNKVELNDVLVGEVWLLSGQSNMDYPLSYIKGGRELINEEPNALMRFFDIKEEPRETPYGPADIDRSKLFWRIADPKSRERMSSVGVLFGNRIFRELNVPVGLINASYGGSELQAWMPWDWTNASGERDWVEGADRRIKGWKEKDLVKWQKLSDDERAKKKKPNIFEGRVASCYNAKIAPIAPFMVRGELWYQGEGNAGAPKPYFGLFKTYAEKMRELFKNPDMPIYTVQLPDYTNNEWAAFRETQRQIALRVTNVGMAVTIDGHEMDLHPRDKDSVGKRLAELALSEVYGKKYEARSPVAPKAAFFGKAVKVKFDNAYEGLKTSDGQPPRTFQLSADGKSFVDCVAKLTGKDEVSVKVPEGMKAVQKVRYGWAADPDANLLNGAGLPASPFEEEVKR